MQVICDSLGPTHIDALLHKWMAILPNPFTPEDETAGTVSDSANSRVLPSTPA